jgi:hypothetical protein
MVVRFVVEFLKATAIIIGLPLISGFAVQIISFWFSDRDVGGAFGSSLFGITAGCLGLIFAIIIVLRRIADIED